ncbi:MAG TPA: hypothetical protein VM913_04855 [Sphingomicrobium sp.]|jgi:hypothetical protein|nr:hypothetical protein [Sphingomicrobium sp.]
MTSFTPDQWIILGLVFVLGLLVGMWMTSGGRRKWKARYTEELDKRRSLEKSQGEREAHWASREKEWREQDSLRGAARERGPVVDRDRDGYPDRPLADRDDDGYRERPLTDRDGDGYRDRPSAGNRRPGDIDGDGIPNRGDPHPADRRR